MPDFLVVILVLGAIASIVVFSAICWHVGYKKGQIDALGEKNIEYHLVDHHDGSKTWEKI